MKPLFLATVTGVLLAAPFCAQAGEPARPQDPLDPAAPVPMLAYDSAMRAGVRPSADAAATPDKNWRRANEAVAGSAGGDGQHAHAAAPAPAASAPAPGAAPAPAPAHSHHHPAPGKQ